VFAYSIKRSIMKTSKVKRKVNLKAAVKKHHVGIAAHYCCILRTYVM